MRIRSAIRRPGLGLAPQAGIQDAAVLMERAGVGALVVLDGDQPVGILTDRDLVRRALAKGLPPDARIDSVMTAPVITIDGDADSRAAYGLFRQHAIRRLVVVDDHGFIGMITVDDLVIDLAADLADLARPITAETIFGQRDATVPAVPASSAQGVRS